MAKEGKVPTFIVGIVITVLSVLHTLILDAVNSYVTAPYMDEYFHHDQLQAYSEGRYHYWNDKLTTPPGLYLIDLLIIKPCMMLGLRNVKLLNFGRAINTYFYSLATLLMVYKILNYYYSRTERSNLERAVFIHLLPTHFFFHFLLYTDTGSTFFVLLAYYMTLCNRTTLGAIFAFVAVLFRQTNIVWILYFCVRKYIHDKRHHFINQDVRLSLYLQIRILIDRAWHDKWVLVRKFKLYLLLVLAFAYFLCYNKGVVLGDRRNHEPAFHPTQILYFLLFSIPLLSIPLYFYLFNFNMAILQQFRRIKLVVMFLLLTSICAVIVSQFTITHRFMVADNRHYIFYIWKNFFLRYSWFKYALCPLYAMSILFIIPLFITSREKIMVFGLWLACTTAVLMPAKLVEFRYFTIPMILLQFEIKPFRLPGEGDDDAKEVGEGSEACSGRLKKVFTKSVLPRIFGFLACNLALYYVFLFRPFTLENGDTGRFMW